MGLVYDDLPTKQRLDLYDQAFTGLTKKKFDPPEDLATGGRVGFRIGSESGKDTSGRDYASNTAASRSVATSPSRNTGGGGDNNNNQPPQKINIPKPIKDAGNTAGELMFLKNVFELNPVGIMKNIGTKMFLDKLISDADTQQDQNMMLAFEPGSIKDKQLKQMYNIFEETGIENPMMKDLMKEDIEQGGPLSLPEEAYQTAADGGRVGLKVGTGKRFLQRVFGKEGFEEMKTRDPEMYIGLLEVVDMYRKRDKEGLKMYLQKFLPHMDDAEIEDFIRGSEGSEGLVGELIRLGSGRDYKGKLEMIKKSEEMKKLRDLEVTDDMIRKPNADGGIMRLGLKEGSGMTRRTFLKILGGAMSIPIIGKIFKPLKIGKTVTKVPIIKTDAVPGKPEWFDQLVNKVILEGDDVTKRFATAERQSIHQKTLDDGSVVRVTEDVDDGAVRVEYESPENVYEDVVQMQYKKPLPDEGDPKPMAEFTTAESGPVGRADGPDDYSLDIDEISGTSISDLTSDVSKLKAYATGEKPTLKEFIQSKKRKDKARRITEGGEAEMDAVIERQGEFIENDLVDLDPPEFAAGGIARMLGE